MPRYQQMPDDAFAAQIVGMSPPMYAPEDDQSYGAQPVTIAPPTGASDNTAADDWFSQNAPPLEPSYVDPGHAPTYNAPGRPDYLQGPYVAPSWGGGDFMAPERPDALRTPYHLPTMDEVKGEAGYDLGLREGVRGRDMSAAARGSLLSGGQQKALTRFGTDYATTKYDNAVNRGLQVRNQQVGEYNQSVTDAFNQYKQRYQSFLDSANLGFQARGLNENAYQNDVGNSVNQFGARLAGYNADTGAQRTAANDYWSQQMDVANNLLEKQKATRPPV